MNFSPTALPGVIVVEPDVHEDARGFFLESYAKPKYEAGGIRPTFVQDNHSKSGRATLRGLHTQLGEHPQGKLVRVVAGSVYDVAVDIRTGSPHFGQFVGVELSAENFRQLYIPPGFGHGFVVTSESAEFEYKCTDVYSPGDEIAIRWNDPRIGVTWPIAEPLLSGRDELADDLAAHEAAGTLPRYADFPDP